MLLLGITLVAIAGFDVVFLHRTAIVARAALSPAQDIVFGSEISFALYLFPLMFGGIGVNIVSHVMVSRLISAEKRFAREHPDGEALLFGRRSRHTFAHTAVSYLRGSINFFHRERAMPKFVIERAIAGVGASKPAELQAISQKSCGVLQELGTGVQWVQSYVTGDKIYCIYNADNEALVREHARRGGFPADSVARVVTVIDPTTAEA